MRQSSCLSIASVDGKQHLSEVDLISGLYPGFVIMVLMMSVSLFVESLLITKKNISLQDYVMNELIKYH